MKVDKKILTALMIGISLGVVTCSKEKKSNKIQITIKTEEGKDSTIYIDNHDCVACGMG